MSFGSDLRDAFGEQGMEVLNDLLTKYGMVLGSRELWEARFYPESTATAVLESTPPVMEYEVVHTSYSSAQRMVDLLNREAREGWRVVTALGTDVILERPRIKDN